MSHDHPDAVVVIALPSNTRDVTVPVPFKPGSWKTLTAGDAIIATRLGSNISSSRAGSVAGEMLINDHSRITFQERNEQ